MDYGATASGHYMRFVSHCYELPFVHLQGSGELVRKVVRVSSHALKVF